MAGNYETGIEQFSSRELAYFEYASNQATLGEIGSKVVALEAKVSEAQAELTLVRTAEAKANITFRRSLADVHTAIEADETLNPLEKYIWSASFKWASEEQSVTASTDVVGFAAGFQERVEAIQDRMVEGAPFIVMQSGEDNAVTAGVLQGDKFIVNDSGVKTPAIDGTTAWIGYGRRGEWKRFTPIPKDDIVIIKDSWLRGPEPLSHTTGYLDVLGGWDEQPGFAREQRVFIGVDEIKGFLNNSEKTVNARFHGLIAAGFAGVDIASLEEELPDDLLDHRNRVANEIAEAVAANILYDAIKASPDASLRKSTQEHVKYTEMPPRQDLAFYLESLGISQRTMLDFVSVQFAKMGENDFVLKMVTPRVLKDGQVATSVAKIFEEATELVG